MKESEITTRVAKLESMLRHPSAAQIPGVFYEEMFWWLIGVFEAADTREDIDAWTLHCINYTLDRVELEARTLD